MVYPMISISNYELFFKGNKIFIKKIKDVVPCPKCGGELKYRDSRKRIYRKYGGATYWILIRRLICCHCGSLHTELPDCLAPNKHYEVEVIENVVDGLEEVIDTDSLEKQYPCDATRIRWKKWILKEKKNIDSHMKSIGFRVLGLGVELLSSTASILEVLQDEGEGWLSIIIRTIYNSGNFI